MNREVATPAFEHGVDAAGQFLVAVGKNLMEQADKVSSWTGFPGG